MRRLVLLLLLLLAGPAFAQSTPSGFPDATLPLNGLDEVMVDQGAGCAGHTVPCTTSRAPSLRFGQPLVQPTAPLSPFAYQTWWDNSTNPAVYKIYNGTAWVSIYAANTTTGVPSFPGNVYVASGSIGVGTTTVAPNWPITLFSNNTVSGATGVTMNTYENGTGVAGDRLRGFAVRGTLAAPTAAQSGDVLLGLAASGYWSGKPMAYFVAGDDRAAIELQAAENFAATTNNGTQIIFKTTPLASSTPAEVARLTSSGLLGIGTTTPNFGVTLALNNPIPAGGITQGFTANTYEDASGLTGGGFRAFAARGTALVPTALVSNDPILVLSGSGFWAARSTSSWGAADGRATIAFNAAENWSGVSNNGTYMAFSTTAVGAGSQTERMRLNGSGGLGIGTTTDPGVNSVLIAGHLEVGLSSNLTLSTGEIGLGKITASGTAPGAAGGKLELVCGTNAGTGKLILYVGTSNTPVTLTGTDNAGAGLTGC